MTSKLACAALLAAGLAASPAYAHGSASWGHGSGSASWGHGSGSASWNGGSASWSHGGYHGGWGYYHGGYWGPHWGYGGAVAAGVDIQQQRDGGARAGARDAQQALPRDVEPAAVAAGDDVGGQHQPGPVSGEERMAHRERNRQRDGHL